jgi:hypothetical protein
MVAKNNTIVCAILLMPAADTITTAAAAVAAMASMKLYNIAQLSFCNRFSAVATAM